MWWAPASAVAATAASLNRDEGTRRGPRILLSLRGQDQLLHHTHQALTDGEQHLPLLAGTRGRNGNYSRSELEAWAERLAGWSERLDVYAYFNNDWEGHAVKDALYLKRRLLQEGATGVQRV
jgi:uncharacterized protein YecE (DUF72 family)